MIAEQREFTQMLTLKDVKNILGVSYGVVKGLIASGYIRAYKVTGEPISCNEVENYGYGLRVHPDDLRQYLSSRFVK